MLPASSSSALCRTLPRLRTLATKVSLAQSMREPALFTIAVLVGKLADIVLPRIGKNQVTWMSDVASRLAELRAVADDYAIPAWASPDHRMLMIDLAALEAALSEPEEAVWSRAS